MVDVIFQAFEQVITYFKRAPWCSHLSVGSVVYNYKYSCVNPYDGFEEDLSYACCAVCCVPLPDELELCLRRLFYDRLNQIEIPAWMEL